MSNTKRCQIQAIWKAIAEEAGMADNTRCGLPAAKRVNVE
jgi:hypothetical protein